MNSNDWKMQFPSISPGPSRSCGRDAFVLNVSDVASPQMARATALHASTTVHSPVSESYAVGDNLSGEGVSFLGPLGVSENNDRQSRMFTASRGDVPNPAVASALLSRESDDTRYVATGMRGAYRYPMVSGDDFGSVPYTSSHDVSSMGGPFSYASTARNWAISPWHSKIAHVCRHLFVLTLNRSL